MSNPFQNYQSVLLNVIAVRFNPTKNMSLSDGDPSWNTITVAPGAKAGAAFGSFSFGGSFGPNGNPISFGQARSEMQIDLALLQNNLTVFNTGKIYAQQYYQVELLLDGGNPATLVPLCGQGKSVGEGCITYPTQFPAGFTSIRFPAYGSPNATEGILNIARNTTTLVPIAINGIPGPQPADSTSPIAFEAEICPIQGVPNQNTNPSNCTFSPGATPPPQGAYSVGAVLQGQVHGASGTGTVLAEISGTGTVVSGAYVSKNSKRDYYMMLPAGTYDLIASSPASRSFDVRSHVVLKPEDPANPSQSGVYNMDFSLKSAPTRQLRGNVVDACSGVGVSGAEVEIYGPPNWVDNIPCSPSPTPATSATPFPTPPPQCLAQCDHLTADGAPPDGCVVLASSATANNGAYPFTTSGSAPSAFSSLPVLKDKKTNQVSGYGLKATASGYNGRFLTVRIANGVYKCDGSGFQNDACNPALQHGTLMVNLDAGSKVTGNPLNVLVNVEDEGTFNGEGLELTTIPVGKSSPAPFPITVPIYEPSPAVTVAPTPAAPNAAAAKATPTATSTPVDIGGAPTYDLFASVQDLFGAAPQKVGGHTYAVLSGVPAPEACATVTAPGVLSGLTCVGHGSIQGSLANVDQDTLLSVSKLSPLGDDVQISQSRVPQLTSPLNFSICAPVDDYTVTHYEAQPTGTPVAVPGGSAPASLSGPVTIPKAPGAPCYSICSADTPVSTPSASPTGGQCLLCQGSAPIPGILP